MKRIITAIAFILITTGAFAQFNKGRWLAGGSVGFSTTTFKSDNGNTTTTEGKSTSFSFSPDAGYFVMDNLAVGGSLSLGASSFKSDGSSDKSSGTSILLVPFARYYLPQGVFFQAQVGFGSQKVKNTYSTGQTTITTETKNGLTRWSLGAGYAYFLNDFVAIEPILSYQSSIEKNKDTDNRDIANSLGLNIALQVYLGPRN